MSLVGVTRPAAAAEIETAYRWYEKEREGLGSEFLDAVDKMVKVIADDPLGSTFKTPVGCRASDNIRLRTSVARVP